MKTLLKLATVSLLLGLSVQLVFLQRALAKLNSAAKRRSAQLETAESSPSPPPAERRLFLVSDATVDQNNYEMRKRCMYYNQSKMKWPTW